MVIHVGTYDPKIQSQYILVLQYTYILGQALYVQPQQFKLELFYCAIGNFPKK